MKINLKPTVEMTNEEKETLRAFVADFETACDDIGSCEVCPLQFIREDCNLSDSCSSFISRVLDKLNIN